MTKVESQEIQTLNLKDAYNLAEANYPLITDQKLIEEIYLINLEVINKERLPYITHNVEGQIQSDNVTIDGGDPSSPLNVELPLETFKAYVDMNFDIYNGGLVSAKKKVEEVNRKVSQQHLKVSLRTLKDRINDLFFAIQLAKQQKKLLRTSIDDIETNIKTQQTNYVNGTVLESEVSKLRVRKLELQSDDVRLDGDIQAYYSVLGKLIGVPLSPTIPLVLPGFSTQELNSSITRPEQQLYEYQKELLTAQEDIIRSSRRPKISLFAQGGVGNPNPLNFADTETATYGLGGVRVQWNILDWGKGKKEREKLKVQIQQTEIDKQTFEFDIASRRDEFTKKIEALFQQLENDQNIVELQKEILKQSSVQLNNGVINSNDYLLQVNAELSARQELELHKVQLQQLQIEYLTLFGKL